MDYGERYTRKAEADIERKMRKIYRQAQEEIIQKLDAHNTQMNTMARVWQSQLESGKITKAKFNRLMNEEIFKSKQWKAKVTGVTRTLLEANRQSNAIIEGQKRAVYGENLLYQAFNFEKGYSGFSFDIYDSATVTRMLRDEPELLPRKVINGRKDEAWNRENISNAVTQGIIQGESIDQIAERIAKSTASTNEKAMVRYARTAMTSAQNAGRIEAMHEAQEMGIKVKKRWLATLDSRTRDSHAHLDGETVDVDDKFSNGLEYPGDPHGEPGEVYNCRCTLEYVYPEYEGLSENAQRRDNESGEVIEDMTYSKWREKHPLPEKQGKQPLPAENAKQLLPLEKKEEKQEEYGEKTKAYVERVKSQGIEAVQIKKYEAQPTKAEIVTHIAGGDETVGSCASMSLAYVGNCAGYDVLDFRDGKSREFFGIRDNSIMMSQMDGVKATIVTDGNDYTAAKKLLAGMETSKEYILYTGYHSSVVRKTEGGYEYLELQDEKDNGWKKFSEDTDTTLRYRFGCKKWHSFMGERYERENLLIDAESLAESKGLPEILQYINTEADKQHKGGRGHAK